MHSLSGFADMFFHPVVELTSWQEVEQLCQTCGLDFVCAQIEAALVTASTLGGEIDCSVCMREGAQYAHSIYNKHAVTLRALQVTL